VKIIAGHETFGKYQENFNLRPFFAAIFVGHFLAENYQGKR
jgi:hypothetical protein